jgi:hypothetical protein
LAPDRRPSRCLGEGVVAQVGPRADDHGQRDDDPERGGCLQPPGVIPALLVPDVLGQGRQLMHLIDLMPVELDDEIPTLDPRLLRWAD